MKAFNQAHGRQKLWAGGVINGNFLNDLWQYSVSVNTILHFPKKMYTLWKKHVFISEVREWNRISCSGQIPF